MEITHTQYGLRVVDDDDVWTFRRDLGAYDNGDDVWIPDLAETPQQVVDAVRDEGYEVAVEVGSEH